MIERRLSPRNRRRGEDNGPVSFSGIGWFLIDLIAVCIIAYVAFGCGQHWERVKGEIMLKEVPKTEYRGKR